MTLPLEVPNMPDHVFEACVRALHGAPAAHPSLALLLSMTDNPKALRVALSLAYMSGVMSHLAWNPLATQAVDLDQVPHEDR